MPESLARDEQAVAVVDGVLGQQVGMAAVPGSCSQVCAQSLDRRFDHGRGQLGECGTGLSNDGIRVVLRALPVRDMEAVGEVVRSGERKHCVRFRSSASSPWPPRSTTTPPASPCSDQAAERCGMRLEKALVDQDFKEAVIIHGALLDIDVEVVRHNPADQGKSPAAVSDDSPAKTSSPNPDEAATRNGLTPTENARCAERRARSCCC
ncbi:hypothetical protein AB0D46_14295 [Streptomyces sp. NPDC048383]|uniref:hypothetical protein n=1 Tax=Streptomyces sp. NPDC048383 TaxID=3155386 RepID=UPI003423FF39